MQQQVLYAPTISPPPLPTPPGTHFLRLLQIWQWEGQSLLGVINLCEQYGFTGLLVKALDGTSWMSQFDSHPDALGSVSEVRSQADVVHDANLNYFTWTNPLQKDYLAQATLTARISEACDGVFLDVEPYAQFWGATAPVGRAREFMETLRGVSPDAFVVLQPDPRPARLAEIRVEEWLPYCDALSGQHYWSDFQSSPTGELLRAKALGETWNVPVLPTLPGNAPFLSFPLDLISSFPGFVVWRMGSTPGHTLATLGGLSVAGLHSNKIPQRSTIP